MLQQNLNFKFSFEDFLAVDDNALCRNEHLIQVCILYYSCTVFDGNLTDCLSTVGSTMGYRPSSCVL
jgi:hypothetical protein